MLYAEITLLGGEVIHTCPADFVFATRDRGQVAAGDLQAGDFVMIPPSDAYLEVDVISTTEVG
jgi:hypothetical protein